MNPQQRAVTLGVLFVAASAALGFADALLCLIGAVVFCLATAIYRDELDIAELPQRPSPTPSVRLAERTNPLLGSVTVNAGQCNGSEAQLRSGPNPSAVGLQQMRSINDLPGRGTRSHVTDLPKHRTVRPSTAARR